jgi:hypothetical protein
VLKARLSVESVVVYLSLAVVCSASRQAAHDRPTCWDRFSSALATATVEYHIQHFLPVIRMLSVTVSVPAEANRWPANQQSATDAQQPPDTAITTAINRLQSCQPGAGITTSVQPSTAATDNPTTSTVCATADSKALFDAVQIVLRGGAGCLESLEEVQLAVQQESAGQQAPDVAASSPMMRFTICEPTAAGDE